MESNFIEARIRKGTEDTSSPDPVSEPPAKDKKTSQQCDQILKPSPYNHCTFFLSICQIYHLEVPDVDVTAAGSEATEDPSHSANHQLDHPDHDVGGAESIILSSS